MLSIAAVATIYWELASLWPSAELFILWTFLVFAASMWGKSEMKELVTQSCLTLCDPIDCSPPGSAVHGILQARILEWVALSSPPGNLPNPGIEPRSPASQAITGRFPIFPINQQLLFSRWVMSDSVTPCTAARQASRPSPAPGLCPHSCLLSWWRYPTISSSVTPLLLLHSILPSIRVFSIEPAFHTRGPKYWSFNFSISLSSEYSRIDFLFLIKMIFPVFW